MKIDKDLKHLHNIFLEECNYAGMLRPETLRGYRACFSLLLKFKEDITLEELNPATMLAFYKWLHTRKRIIGKNKIETGVKDSTVATYRNKLDKFYKWLQVHKFLKNDPFLGVPYPHVRYSDRKFLRREDVEKIFTTLAYSEWHTTLNKRRNIAMYTVLLNCGLRKGELIGLKMLDVNFEHCELLVRAEISKSKIDRYIPLNKAAITALKEYIQERQRGKYTTPFLWVSSIDDKPFTQHGLKHLNKKIIDTSGIKFHLHQFRHTFAVNMLSTGTDIYKLKQMMGHTEISMTCAYLRCMPTNSMQQDVEKLSLNRLI